MGSKICVRHLADALFLLPLKSNLIPLQPKVILEGKQFEVTILRLCHQLIEIHDDFKDSVIIGLQPRGIYLANRISTELRKILKNKKVNCGNLDITFFRDDFRKKELIPNSTNIDFIIEDKNVIMVDDVLFTGRTIRAGLDAMLAFGRPKDVELLVLVDRRFSRNVPIQAKYTGMVIDSIESQNVKVDWKELDGKDRITLFTK
jgi:pyrimidine operon attenuation protein/uracil phosphoribosyltransferase